MSICLYIKLFYEIQRIDKTNTFSHGHILIKKLNTTCEFLPAPSYALTRNNSGRIQKVIKPKPYVETTHSSWYTNFVGV